VPETFRNLPLSEYLFSGFNALYGGSPALDKYLRSKDKGWFKTQTVPPTGLSAVPTGTTSIRLSWLPITFTQGPGGYKVLYSRSASGPFEEFGRTADKLISSMNVTGLRPGTRYYFQIITHSDPQVFNFPSDPNAIQKNAIDSDPSVIVSATTGGKKVA
jgi:hypothetical protein